MTKPAASVRPIPPSNGPLAPLLPSWQRHLRAANRTVDTIDTYMQGAARLDRYLDAEGVTDVEAVTGAVLESWIGHLLDGGSAATASNRWRSVKQLLKWLVAEGELPSNPAVGVEGPKVVEQPPDVITPAQIKLLLGSCSTKTFEDVRDRALILFLYDNGARLSGILGLDVDDVDLDAQAARIVLKGGEALLVPFGAKTSEALDRYIRARRKHRYAHLPALWVHRRGRLDKSGLQTMLRRRGERSGAGHVHPHLFRHTAAHEMKSAGASDDVLMAIFGWKDPTMAQRYGRSAAAARAREAHRHLSPGDRL